MENQFKRTMYIEFEQGKNLLQAKVKGDKSNFQVIDFFLWYKGELQGYKPINSEIVLSLGNMQNFREITEEKYVSNITDYNYVAKIIGLHGIIKKILYNIQNNR